MDRLGQAAFHPKSHTHTPSLSPSLSTSLSTSLSHTHTRSLALTAPVIARPEGSPPGGHCLHVCQSSRAGSCHRVRAYAGIRPPQRDRKSCSRLASSSTRGVNSPLLSQESEPGQPTRRASDLKLSAAGERREVRGLLVDSCSCITSHRELRLQLQLGYPLPRLLKKKVGPLSDMPAAYARGLNL